MFHQLNSLFHKCLVHILIWFLSATRQASPPDGWLHFSQGDIARGHQKYWFLEVARLRYYAKRLSNFKTTQALYPAIWSSGNMANFVWGELDNHGIQGNFMIQLLPGGHHSAILDVATDCHFFFILWTEPYGVLIILGVFRWSVWCLRYTLFYVFCKW